MKILIVTVAGMSTRFSESVGRDTIKCLYNNSSIKECLLYRLLKNSEGFDKYIIVGGYKFNELERAIKEEFSEFSEKIELVENQFYKEYGSGYSLYLGIKKAIEMNAEEILFAEGDLYLDYKSYRAICQSEKSVISISPEPILANKAVALYVDEDTTIHYIYDTGHRALVIDRPFLAIYNSGQVWKFSDMNILFEIFNIMTLEEWKGTNLVFIEKYFQNVNKNDYEMISFEKWINCNKVNDYNKIKSEELC